MHLSWKCFGLGLRTEGTVLLTLGLRGLVITDAPIAYAMRTGNDIRSCYNIESIYSKCVAQDK